MGLARSMRILGVMASVLGLGVISHPCTAQEPAAAGVESEGSLKDYLTRVKPLLRARCYACHGGLKQKAGLRLDTVGADASRGRFRAGGGAREPRAKACSWSGCRPATRRSGCRRSTRASRSRPSRSACCGTGSRPGHRRRRTRSPKRTRATTGRSARSCGRRCPHVRRTGLGEQSDRRLHRPAARAARADAAARGVRGRCCCGGCPST